MNYLNSEFDLEGSMEFLNRWKISPEISYQNESLDTRLLRGGSAILLPSKWDGSLAINSDMSKKIFISRKDAPIHRRQITNEDEMFSAIQALAKKISDKIGLMGRVLKKNDDGTYLINIGTEDNVREGAELDVTRLGEAIIDPETGAGFFPNDFTESGGDNGFSMVVSGR